MKCKWRIIKMPDYTSDFPDMVEPAYILFDGKGGGKFTFGCVTAPLLEPVTATPSNSIGRGMTKWTRPAETDGLSFRLTAPSKAKSAPRVAMKPTLSRVRGRLLQQPARSQFVTSSE